MSPLLPGTQRTSSPTPSSQVGPPRLGYSDGYGKESPVATARLAPKLPPSSTIPWPLTGHWDPVGDSTTLGKRALGSGVTTRSGSPVPHPGLELTREDPVSG